MNFAKILSDAATSGVRKHQSQDDHQKFGIWIQNQFSKNGKKSDLTYLGPLKKQHGNAMVCMAYDNELKTLVVVKRHLRNSDDGDYAIPIQALYELNTYLILLKQTHSKHLPIIYNVHITKCCTDLILEYIPLPFADLFGNFHSPIEFTELKIKELIVAVKTLHGKNIAHRDIKSYNIRFQKDSSLTLIDLDASSCVRYRTTVPVVTLNYRSPELLALEHDKKENITYDAFACDWWSVGCILAEMVLGECLFEATIKTTYEDMMLMVESFLEILHSGGFEPLRRRMPVHLYLLLKSLLTKNPKERMTNILQHTDFF